jgi:exopolysaccharide biosynthesis polyprenyl glycosylphosphotransferase
VTQRLEPYRHFSPERAQTQNRNADVVLLGVAASVAATFDGTFHRRDALTLFAATGLLWILASRILRQYDAENGRGFFGDVALTLVMITAIVLPTAALGLVAAPYASPARAITLGLVLLPTMLVLRVRSIGLRLWRSRPDVDVLIAGTGAFGRLTGAEIGDADTHRRLIGYVRFEDEAPSSRLHAPCLGTIDDLEATLRRHVVHEVYFASTSNDHTRQVQAAIRVCEELGVPFALPTCTYRLTRAKALATGVVSDGYTHFLSSQVEPLQWWTKRLFDIAASAAALLALSPLLVVTALAVRLTSRGPILFRQERVGLLGRRFNMLKFRSMVVDAEAQKARLALLNEQTGPVFKMIRDPRVTAVGRFIRKYSIDELPQLVNVLRGDMSIVGPRPNLPSEVVRYEAWQRRRLSVRPGLTCIWQVSGRNAISFRDWMLLDMRYIDHWSLACDLDIILKTLPVVLTGRGAS